MASQVEELKRAFAQVDWVSFDETNGLVRVHVSVPTATATIYLQGAHLSQWQPKGEAECVYFSRKSELTPGRPLRGGIPIVFPWFAMDKKTDRIDGHPGPMHGFARVQNWKLTSVKCEEDAAVVEFELGSTSMSRRMGFDQFMLTAVFRIGRKLNLSLRVTNVGHETLTFEEAFHTYLKIADIHEVRVKGLEPTGFIDKMDNFRFKGPEEKPIVFTKATDRVYENTSAPCVVHDEAGRRAITVAKTGSHSTIIWNPFRELPDLGEWEWHEMVAVETANVGSDTVSVAPQASQTMAVTISVERLAPGRK